METVQFEFSNGVIYSGFCPGEDFMGKSLVYASPDVLARILKDLRDGFGPRQPPKGVVERIMTLEPRWSWKEVALWNMGCQVVRSVDLIMVEDRSEPRDAEAYEERILEGNYFDVIVNSARDRSSSAQRFIGESRVETLVGRFDDVTSAIDRATALGASERQRNRHGKLPDAVTSGDVHRRFYRNEACMCLPLTSVVDDIPTYRTRSERAACRKWATTVEREAKRKNPGVSWFGGVDALMDSIDLMSKSPSGTA